MTIVVFYCAQVGGADSWAGSFAAIDRRAAAAPNIKFWRSRDNDGINCLYLELRFLGYRDSYADFRKLVWKGEAFRDLGSLAQLSNRAGIKLAAARLTIDDLRNTHFPVLIHEERGGIGSGSFSLLLQVRGSDVYLINGPTMSWQHMERDRFERGWTGYALVPLPPSTVVQNVRRLCCVCLIVVTLIVVAKMTVPWDRDAIEFKARSA